MLLCYTDLFNLHKYELDIMPVELTFQFIFIIYLFIIINFYSMIG